MILGSILIITCFYFIISPFFTSSSGLTAESNGDQPGEALDTIYMAVNELEMDYLMKKITKEDYDGLKRRYQLLASSYLKAENTHKGLKRKREGEISQDIDREILEELQKLRKKQGRKKG